MKSLIISALVFLSSNVFAGNVHVPIVTCKNEKAKMSVTFLLNLLDNQAFYSSKPFNTEAALMEINSREEKMVVDQVRITRLANPLNVRVTAYFEAPMDLVEYVVQMKGSEAKITVTSIGEKPTKHEYSATCSVSRITRTK